MSISQDQKVVRNVVSLSDNGQVSRRQEQGKTSFQNHVKKAFNRMMAHVFISRFEAVEKEVLKDKRFFVIEHRQTPAYTAFFEKLHEELSKDPLLESAVRTKSDIEAGLKNVKMASKPERRMMDPTSRASMRNIVGTQASNRFVRKPEIDTKGNMTSRGCSPPKITQSGFKDVGIGRKFDGEALPATPMEKKGIASVRSIMVKGGSKMAKSDAKVCSTRDLKVPVKPLTKAPLELDQACKTEYSSKSNNHLSDFNYSKENKFNTGNLKFGGRSQGFSVPDTPSERSKGNPGTTLNGIALLKLAQANSEEDDNISQESEKSYFFGQKMKKRLPAFLEEEELANNSNENSKSNRRSHSAGSTFSNKKRNLEKKAKPFDFSPLESAGCKFAAGSTNQEEQALIRRNEDRQGYHKVQAPHLQSSAKKKISSAAKDRSSAKNKHAGLFKGGVVVSQFVEVAQEGPKKIDFGPNYNPLPDIEMLETILRQRAETVREEHYETTKEQIIEKAKRFLPENSRTLQLFQQSRFDDCDILIDSMRHSLRAKIQEIDRSVATSRLDWPEFRFEIDLPAVRALPFQPSTICLLAFHTVSKKDVIRGMSPELLSADLAKLFVLFKYLQLEKTEFEAVAAMKKADLLSDVCDYYLAQLELKSDTNISRCNEFSLAERMKLEEYLEANKSIFRVVSDVNINSFYMSVAFWVFEALFFYGMRSFVLFMEKRKDKVTSRRNAGFELKYLAEKREFFERRLTDLDALEEDLKVFNKWSRSG